MEKENYPFLYLCGIVRAMIVLLGFVYVLCVISEAIDESQTEKAKAASANESITTKNASSGAVSLASKASQVDQTKGKAKYQVRIHQCAGTGHFVFTAPDIPPAKRSGFLGNAVHDWTKHNYEKWQVTAGVGFVEIGETTSVQIWANPIPPAQK